MKKQINTNVQIEVDGCSVELTWQFSLIEPQDKVYYGTGFYMVCECGGNEHYIDERYAGTTDIFKLSEMFLKSIYGDRLKGVVYENP